MGGVGFKLAMLAAVLLGYGHFKAEPGRCPYGMAFVDGFCIDRWEDYVVELDADGVEHEHSPYETVDGVTVRAKTAAGGRASRVHLAGPGGRRVRERREASLQ